MRPISRNRPVLAAIIAATGLLAATVPASAQSLEQRFSVLATGSTASIDHGAWDKLLKAYVVPSPDGVNRIAYARFKKDGHKDLKAYVAALQKVDVAKLDRAEQLAFWANLYNAKTIDIVLDKYPVKSIKDINLGGSLLTVVTGGPWKAKVAKVGRPGSVARRHRARDPASGVQGPAHPLRRQLRLDRVPEPDGGGVHRARSWKPSSTPARRPTSTTRAASRSPAARSRRRASTAGSRPTSAARRQGVLEHVRKYASPALKQQLESITGIADFDYDWNLNESKQ